MRTNLGVRTRSLWILVLTLAALGTMAGSAAAQCPASEGDTSVQTVNLIAAAFTKTVLLPSGRTVSVPMWGYGLAGQSATAPGPRITVAPGKSRLCISIENQLDVPTSIVIPGQAFDATPGTFVDPNGNTRVRSMTAETEAGATGWYEFKNLKPGTFLYESGSHMAVQVQMGLYGAMTLDSDVGQAYPGSPAVNYGAEALLVYSEIDLDLHDAVANGTYGTPAGPTSTLKYRPSLFLVNGESYTPATAAVAAGSATPAVPTLLRFVNAGLRTHIPQLGPTAVPGAVLDKGLKIVAEDGNKLTDPKDQAGVMLAAGKTHDVLWTPTAPGTYSVFDRMLSLNAPGQGEAGMLAKLGVAGEGPTDQPSCLTAGTLSYSTTQGAGIHVLFSGATAATSPQHGTLTPSAGGGYSYLPSAAGIDSFTYTVANGCAPGVATIIVTGGQNAPVATSQAVAVEQDSSVVVTLSATDSNGDPLTYFVSQAPMKGHLSIYDPVTKVETCLTAADLYGAPGKKAIPAGQLVYTATQVDSDCKRTGPAATGADPFNFVASDGPLSSQATVTATVQALVADDFNANITLNVVGADGTPITNYRWTLEEDHTYKVVPGVPDPATLAVSFHSSYMPVKDAGCAGSVNCTSPRQPRVNAAKRYFVSVLPTVNTYSNGGAEIESIPAPASRTVRITVAKLPLPTARIRVRVFQDNAPLDGMWSGDEPGLQGFQVTIDDAGGTYGMSGGHQSTDALGNKIGTTYTSCTRPYDGECEVDKLGDGFVLTDADGYATIENLPMGKYTVKVRAPGGQKWIQTTTIEGQPGIDAWVKPNEPQFFTEFGPPGPHVFVGFVQAVNSIPQAFRGNGSITGRVTNMRMPRPPDTSLSSGAPFEHTRPWVALNSAATEGGLLYTQPVNEDGTFTIPNVQAGTYQLVVFDSALDIIIADRTVTVAGTGATALGDVPVFNWFTSLYAYVYDDLNRNGHHDDGEPGMPDQALNIRFRDGSIYQSLSTDDGGFKAFNEVFPFFAWMIAEVDYTRFHSTGLTVVVDGGGTASVSNDWQAQAGLPAGLVPPNALNPQPQAENGGAPFREESGAETPFLLLEGFQGFVGQSTVMLWGKAPYETGSFSEDVSVAPFDDFPGPGDFDANGDGFFNTDRRNGGIAGIVHYGITRAENDPRWAVAENWDPGVSEVRVQLWDESRTHLLNEVVTDSWDKAQPEGCQGPVFTFRGRATDCYDGLRNFNQARPAVFDGGYAFSTILQRSGVAQGHEYDVPVRRCDTAGEANCRNKEIPIPAGKYVVKIIVPKGYVLQKEEDKNVDFGDQYVPQQFWLAGDSLADASGAPPGDAQPAPTVVDNALIAPFCVGQLHKVPETLSLFPGQMSGTFAGELRPLCDAKLVTLRPGQQAAPDFHLFTEAPVAGHVYGMVLDDTTNEFDPNAPTFGEKYAPQYLPIAFRDWQGREIARTHTDEYGVYNALVPSTYTIQVPQPSGVSPSIIQACINPPTKPDPANPSRQIPDPLFQKQYSHFCYPLQYLPGKTTYLDTPVLPTGAFTGTGQFPVDAELPNRTPIIATVNGPLNIGPYIVSGNDGQRTITIRSAGKREVTNPLYGGAGSTQPKTIVRDYGFGAAGGFVTLGGTRIAYSSWTDDTIVAVVPAMPPALPAPSVAQMAASHTGELAVERCLGGKTGATSTTGSCNDGRKSVLGITLTVATSQMHAARAPVVVSPGQKIQAAINAAKPGDLLLVQPGTYEEMLVMTKPVRLQGVGSSSTIINVVTAPSENVQAWLDYVGPLLSANSGYLLPGQPAFATTGSQGLAQPGDVAAVLGDEGAAVTVLGKNLVSLLGICPFAFNNAPATESAYCLHDENYPNLLRPWLRPNARIDGFTITGANSAPGVMLNGYNRYLEVSNNRIHTNAGTNAGGILLGHVGQQDLGDVNAHNEFVSIHNNLVTQNAGLESTGGGGVVIGAGSANYRVYENFVVANFAAGQGAGVSHIGSVATSLFGPNADPDAAFLMPTFWGSTTDVPSSDRNVGVIDRNTIVFNESFSQGVTTTGGGVFVGGTPPAAGAPQLGSGNVRISNNLIQGNAASGGDGGGVSLLGTAGQSNYVVGLYNNIIANNVAAFAGGGVVLRDAGRAELVHDTIVNNDSLGTAGDAFIGPTQSAPSVSGVFVRNTLGGSSDPNRPKITNTIIWHNRSFRFGPTSGGFQVPGAPTTYGLIACTSSPCTADGFWDLGASGGTLQTFGTTTSTGGTAPSFVAQYVNGDRHSAYQTDAGTTILVPAALDEGGNFIRPQFGPLSLTRANDTRFANYHLSAPDPGISLSSSTGSGGYGTGTGAVPAALLFDIDAQPRPTATPHRGADQVTGFVPQPTALDDAATTTGGPVTITVLTNDNLATPAAGKPLLVTGIANLVGGSATTDGTTVIYTPQAGFNGLGSLTYTVSGPGGEASAVVRINVGASAPQLSVSPSALNFGDLNRGSVSAPQTVTVSNLGNAALTGLAVSLAGGDAGEFALPPPPGCGSTLAVGASCNVSVTFGPTSATLGAKEATLNVTESGGSTASVSLVGTSLGTGLTIASAPLAFGFQTINQASPTQTVQIVNNGNDIAYFTWTAGGANLNQFIISDGCPTVPATPPDPRRYVVPGGVCGINVAFRPTSGGLKSASLSITPTGGAAVPVSITGTGVAVGLTRLPAALSFGSVPVGASSASQAVTVTNTGAAPVQIALSFSGSSASQFSQTGSCPVAPAAIAAGANCVANVVFTPTGNGGNRNATLTVTPLGNTALSLTVGLSGTATAPNLALACPSGCFSANSTYSFGPVNGSLSRTFTLSNDGGSALPFTIGSIAVAKLNNGNGSYSVTGGTCVAGNTLSGGQNCTVVVSFQSPGGFPSNTTGRLTVSGTAAGTPATFSVSRNLSGS